MLIEIDEIKQKQAVAIYINYLLLNIQYIQRKQKISKSLLKEPKYFFVNITDESVEIRSIPKQTFRQIIEQGTISQKQVVKQSTLQDLIQLQEISKLDKKALPTAQSFHYIIGVFENIKKQGDGRDTKPSLVLRLESEEIMNNCFEEINTKCKQQKDYIKQSTVNYLGIQQNMRRIIQKVLVSVPAKNQVYNRMQRKLLDRNIQINLQNNKMMLSALMGNHPDVQNVTRKTKIQSYDIEKRRYDDFLKEESMNKIVQIVSEQSNIIEGYSEKRKMDGVILKRQVQKQRDLNNKNNEQLYLNKIPDREEYEVDSLIGIQRDFQDVRIDQNMKDLPTNYKTQKMRIPQKQYSIISKQSEWTKKQQAPPNQSLDNLSLIAIESVKFMYQLMKINSKWKRVRNVSEGPMDQYLVCLKDIMAECESKIQERKNQKRGYQNKNVLDFLATAKKNYMDYRRNLNSKFN